jgi:hypothetical protein
MVCLIAGTRIPTHYLVLGTLLFGGWQAACRLDFKKIHSIQSYRLVTCARDIIYIVESSLASS